MQSLILGMFIDSYEITLLIAILRCSVTASFHYTSLCCRLKCTTLIRSLDFISVLLMKARSTLDTRSILGESLWHVVAFCILDPLRLGFNMADTEVLTNLPENLMQFLRLCRRYLNKEHLQGLSSYLSNFLKQS